jgi:hypothetical protein
LRTLWIVGLALLALAGCRQVAEKPAAAREAVADRILAAEAEIDQIQAKIVPPKGTSRDEVEALYGDIVPESSGRTRREAVPADFRYRSYSIVGRVKLYVLYDEDWRVATAFFADIPDPRRSALKLEELKRQGRKPQEQSPAERLKELELRLRFLKGVQEECGRRAATMRG